MQRYIQTVFIFCFLISSVTLSAQSEAATSSIRGTVVDQSLDEIEVELDPKRFFRINRGFIVSASSIQSIEPYFNHRLLLGITPESDEEVIVSRQRVKEFKHWLDS